VKGNTRMFDPWMIGYLERYPALYRLEGCRSIRGDTSMTAAQIQNALVLCIIVGFATMEFVSRRYKQTVHATGNDTKLELLMFMSVLAVTQPLAIFVTSKLGALWVPQYKGVLADMPWWGMVGVLLVLDDMTQYWWHRLSHTSFL
jgi:sterol desaturase/sphingolipid hydroxylase (fatty acid hydroxylase superfamily)